MILTGLTRDSGEMYQTYFYQGAISAGRAATVFQDAEFDGATGVVDLAVNEGKNAHRDLVRKLMKGSKWPPLYAAKIPVLHQKTHQVWKNLSICCCHMKSWQISCPGTSTPNRRSLTGQGFQLQPESTFRKQCLCWEWIPPPASLLSCGQMVALSNGAEANLSLLLQWALWPNWWHFLQAQNSLVRLLAANIWFLVFLPEAIQRGSFEEFFPYHQVALLRWSTRSLWSRRKQCKQSLQFWRGPSKFWQLDSFHPGTMLVTHSCLPGEQRAKAKVWIALRFSQKLEETGNTFNLSGWSGTDNICYRCYASKETSRDCTSSAVWRSQRKTTMDHFADCITEGKQISALFSAPGLQIGLLCYRLAACLWPGSCPRFSWEFDFSLLDRFPVASKDKRLSSVFRSMQSFYRRYSVDNRLDTLTMGMLRKTDKKQTKSQLPSLEHLLEKPEALLDKSNTFENTIFQATLPMNACYSLLSRDLWNPQELATAGQRFLLLYVSLWQRSWRNVLGGSNQAPPLPGAMWIWWVLPLNWTYRDEDMGGTVAAISRRRGGEPCLPFGVCLFFFPLLHSNLVWCHMISHIWGKYHCFNFRKYIVQIHVSTRTSRVACCMKRKKEFLSSRH